MKMIAIAVIALFLSACAIARPTPSPDWVEFTEIYGTGSKHTEFRNPKLGCDVSWTVSPNGLLLSVVVGVVHKDVDHQKDIEACKQAIEELPINGDVRLMVRETFTHF